MFPGGSDGKGSACYMTRPEFNPWVRKIPWRKEWQPPSVFLPGEFHGERSLAGYSPWGCKESDMTEYEGVWNGLLEKAACGPGCEGFSMRLVKGECNKRKTKLSTILSPFGCFTSL